MTDPYFQNSRYLLAYILQRRPPIFTDADELFIPRSPRFHTQREI